MTLEHFRIISLIQQTLPIIIVVLVTIRFRQRETYIKRVGLVALLMLISSASSLIFHTLLKIKGSGNLIGNLYTLVAVGSWLLVYSSIIKSKKYDRILLIVFLIFLAFGIINLLFIQGNQINSYTLLLMSLVFIVLSLDYFYRIIKNPPTDDILSLPFFWINSGRLLFASVTFILFLLTDFLINVLHNNLIYYWTTLFIMIIIDTIFTSVGVWKELQTHK